ncbi:hypothetical protein HMPREF0063_10110 [Aeromicrobium marinum DSM 15272]|uniref:Uncharacterized protein n=1 Tax=Aeromicrobium marinum DSM 15272 TaxID=585531 RepID=E2S7V3_9ACTN|nr:hypothetical protein [Aeromicrobium marinum]EFQ84769.1 hypothetical protein HMPREF0063_10110 [Aeromicrobium marinum DSM 15272]
MTQSPPEPSPIDPDPEERPDLSPDEPQPPGRGDTPPEPTDGGSHAR